MDASQERDVRFSMADRAISVGFGLNAILMVMKLAAGYYGHSEAVFADGIESACDFVAIISTWIALKIGRKTFDEDHPYGHGKAESMAAIMVAFVIFAAGIGILYQAVMTFITGDYPKPQGIAVAAAVITIAVKELLFRYTRRIARKLRSPAVEAVSKDHRKDALTSVATLIGVTGAYLGFVYLDPLAAGLTAFFIFYIGWETFRKAGHDLMDGLPSRAVLKQISDTACEISGVDCVHEIRGRRSGQYLIIDLKLEMDPDMTVRRSHEIADQVKILIFSRFSNVGDVMIHINPGNQAHKDLIRL